MNDDEVMGLLGERIEQSFGRTPTGLQQHGAGTPLAEIVEAYARLAELQQTLDGLHHVLLERLDAAQDGKLSATGGQELLEAASDVTDAMASRDAQATALLHLVDNHAAAAPPGPVSAQARRAAAAAAHSPNYPLPTPAAPAAPPVPTTAARPGVTLRRR
ncbi:hypothetical protein ACFY1P_09315 [Streptomyces sp. NPDC001407]|uniref:hypothetical protein n=1 Tax=Streptomyces sp. NPDC001407 TaxID=3364573 RepID=UPI0036789475